jgi:hypothetical protein
VERVSGVATVRGEFFWNRGVLVSGLLKNTIPKLPIITTTENRLLVLLLSS